ncbi:phosphotransferase family protein, partial [Staphylococcus aureus]|uniref:phosphotransferase family protein n=1 Tax=Staphylococcus aureus TaxID=1280 RepID=UPI001EDA7CB8
IKRSFNTSYCEKIINLFRRAYTEFRFAFFTVVHGDVNHNNWLLSDRDELFLVDWEGAMIADPAIDIGMLLYNYVPQQQWSEWLETYGVQESLNLNKRMKWYTVIQSIGLVQWYEEQK